jgi:hypothetical protein
MDKGKNSDFTSKLEDKYPSSVTLRSNQVTKKPDYPSGK